MNSGDTHDDAENNLPPGCQNMDPSVERMPPEGLGLRAKYGTPLPDGTCRMWDGRRYIEVGAEQTHVFGSERWDVFNIRQDALDSARARGTPLIIDGFDDTRDSLALPGLEEGHMSTLSTRTLMALDAGARDQYYLDYTSSAGFLMDMDSGRYLAIIVNCVTDIQNRSTPPQSEGIHFNDMPESHDVLLKVCTFVRNPQGVTTADVLQTVQDFRSSSMASFLPGAVLDIAEDVVRFGPSTPSLFSEVQSFFSSDNTENGTSSVPLLGQSSSEIFDEESPTKTGLTFADLNIFGSLWGGG